MEFTLYNKIQPVCDFEISAAGRIEKILKVHNAAYAPVGVNLQDKISLYEWWKGRSIPASRIGIDQFLREVGLESTTVLPLRSFGLSLSDQYWIKPAGSSITWEEINFFQHDFSTDVGEAFFQDSIVSDKINLLSPNNTSDGWLRKKWIKEGEQTFLVKSGKKLLPIEGYNEVLAFKLAERLGLKHVLKYSLLQDELQGACSICRNFITPDTELVSAYALLTAHPQPKGTNIYDGLLKLGQRLDIPGMEEYLDDMLVLDYLIANEDRHLGNFGFIRDVNTLQYLGPAPIFDNGTSLWCNSRESKLGEAVKAKPFFTSHEQQLALVKHWESYDFSGLAEAGDIVAEVFASANEEECSAKRKKLLTQAVRERVRAISLYQARRQGKLSHAVIVKELQQLKMNTEPIFYYYLQRQGVQSLKYNPDLDKKLIAALLKDGFSIEQCKRIMLNSPHLKSSQHVETLLKSEMRNID